MRRKEQYDNGVHVYFQHCAWMDIDLNMQWLYRTLIPGVGHDTHEKVIFADNVGFQQAKNFHETCRKLDQCIGISIAREPHRQGPAN